jgi:hypothetical protein
MARREPKTDLQDRLMSRSNTLKIVALFVLALAAASAKAQQPAAVFHIQFDQPITASLPQCPNRNYGMCWVRHPSNPVTFLVTGSPLGEDMQVKVDDQQNVIAVIAWFTGANRAYVLEALHQKYGDPSAYGDADEAIWNDALPGRISVSYLFDKPSIPGEGMVMVETPAARAGGLTDKF